jgi:hypothetical protein
MNILRVIFIKEKKSNDHHETIWYKFISINGKQTNEIIPSSKEIK